MSNECGHAERPLKKLGCGPGRSAARPRCWLDWPPLMEEDLEDPRPSSQFFHADHSAWANEDHQRVSTDDPCWGDDVFIPPNASMNTTVTGLAALLLIAAAAPNEN